MNVYNLAKCLAVISGINLMGFAIGMGSKPLDGLGSKPTEQSSKSKNEENFKIYIRNGNALPHIVKKTNSAEEKTLYSSKLLNELGFKQRNVFFPFMEYDDVNGISAIENDYFPQEIEQVTLWYSKPGDVRVDENKKVVVLNCNSDIIFDFNDSTLFYDDEDTLSDNYPAAVLKNTTQLTFVNMFAAINKSFPNLKEIIFDYIDIDVAKRLSKLLDDKKIINTISKLKQKYEQMKDENPIRADIIISAYNLLECICNQKVSMTFRSVRCGFHEDTEKTVREVAKKLSKIDNGKGRVPQNGIVCKMSQSLNKGFIYRKKTGNDCKDERVFIPNYRISTLLNKTDIQTMLDQLKKRVLDSIVTSNSKKFKEYLNLVLLNLFIFSDVDEYWDAEAITAGETDKINTYGECLNYDIKQYYFNETKDKEMENGMDFDESVELLTKNKYKFKIRFEEGKLDENLRALAKYCADGVLLCFSQIKPLEASEIDKNIPTDFQEELFFDSELALLPVDSIYGYYNEDAYFIQDIQTYERSLKEIRGRYLSDGEGFKKFTKMVLGIIKEKVRKADKAISNMINSIVENKCDSIGEALAILSKNYNAKTRSITQEDIDHYKKYLNANINILENRIDRINRIYIPSLKKLAVENPKKTMKHSSNVRKYEEEIVNLNSKISAYKKEIDKLTTVKTLDEETKEKLEAIYCTNYLSKALLSEKGFYFWYNRDYIVNPATEAEYDRLKANTKIMWDICDLQTTSKFVHKICDEVDQIIRESKDLNKEDLIIANSVCSIRGIITLDTFIKIACGLLTSRYDADSRCILRVDERDLSIKETVEYLFAGFLDSNKNADQSVYIDRLLDFIKFAKKNDFYKSGDLVKMTLEQLAHFVLRFIALNKPRNEVTITMFFNEQNTMSFNEQK